MKKISALTLTLVIIACFSTAPAQAGAARRHTIEGFLLGTGVTLLGTAIIHGMNKEHQPSWERHPPQNYSRHKRHKSPRHHRKYARYAGGSNRHGGGHWETQEIWVSDRYEKRWNPGHYNHRGNWVDGRHKKFLVREGHWRTQRVWIPRWERTYRH